MSKIKIAIMGYGNLGRGAEYAVSQNPDMELTAVFTRRDPAGLTIKTPSVPVLNVSEAVNMKNDIDVLIICGGSATDLPVQGPQYASMFNTIDSFDTHAKIPEYFKSMDEASKAAGKLSIISVGWDPGMFSVNRLYSESVLPQGDSYTFWGRGVSQGHSDAIRRIKGVVNAIQYTVPVEKAVSEVRSGSGPSLSVREKHTRECYVVAEDGADKAAIENEIKTMPNYFNEYDTTVHFISAEELKAEHSKMPHGGFVIRSGQSGSGAKHVVEYSLKLESNPEFTAGVLVSYARAAYRLSQKGECGARTVFDIPPALLSPKSAEELRRTML